MVCEKNGKYLKSEIKKYLLLDTDNKDATVNFKHGSHTSEQQLV